MDLILAISELLQIKQKKNLIVTTTKSSDSNTRVVCPKCKMTLEASQMKDHREWCQGICEVLGS